MSDKEYWKSKAERELQKYRCLKISLTTIPEQIEMSELAKYSVRISSISAAPTHGGGNSYEDNLINKITDTDNLKKHYDEALGLVSRIDKCLNDLGLNWREKYILEHIDSDIYDICEYIQKERSATYSIKNRALRKYILAMYGADVPNL